jgi:phosphate/sulfate permease
MSEEEIYQKAKKRVEEKKGFYSHLAVYIVVNVVLVLIWAFTSRGYPWFVWPLGGWGIGLIFHFLSVFLFNKETSWERDEIEKEAAKLRKSDKK